MTVEDVLNRQGWKRNLSLDGQDLSTFSTPTPAHSKRLDFCKKYTGGNVLMYGPPGRGKTHLARGIMKLWIEDGGAAIYWPFMQFLAELRKAMNNKSEAPDSIVEWLCNFEGLVVIDEIGRSKGDVWDRDNVLYPILDRRLHLPTIYLSNYDIEGLADIYDEAIASRFAAAKQIPFPETMEDFRRKR